MKGICMETVPTVSNDVLVPMLMILKILDLSLVHLSLKNIIRTLIRTITDLIYVKNLAKVSYACLS